jgi:hypothetical protein
VTATVRRTAAATEARVHSKSNRLCSEVVGRLETMPTAMLAALAVSVLTECVRRGDQRRATAMETPTE